MNFTRFIKKILRETLIGLLLTGIIAPSLFTGLFIPIPVAEAASNMCSPEDIQGYRDDPNYKPVRYSLLGKVGGVKLDQAATFLADMSDITGAYYDADRDQIVFVGQTETAVPKFDKDDLAVAIKSIFLAEANPGIKIEYVSPEDPAVWGDSLDMNVNYMPSKEGDIGTDNNPSGYWEDENKVKRAATPYGIEDTAFAKILFDADFKLKQYYLGYAHGLEKGTPQRMESSVSGYASQHDRWLAKNPDRSQKRGAIRVWLSPKEGGIPVMKDDTAQSFVFGPVSMKVEIRDVMGQNDDPKWIQAAEEFANHHTENFNAFAAEQPSYQEVQRLAKIVGVVKWLKDNNIPSDFNWARDYEPAFVETPRKINMIRVDEGNLRIGGGINYFEPLTTTSTSSTEAASMKQSAINSQPTSADFHWNFTKDGQQYKAVSVSAEIFRSAGTYSTLATDLGVETMGDNALALTRSYSSQNSGAGYGFGRGWDPLPARLKDIGLMGITPDCTAQGANGPLPTRLAFQTQGGTYETFMYQCTSGFTPDDPSYTSRISIHDNVIDVTHKGNFIYSFSQATLNLSQTIDNNNNRLTYTFGGGNPKYPNTLASIEDQQGHSLSRVSQDAAGRVTAFQDWTGRKVQYQYDEAGRLVSVIDPLGRVTQYQYDQKDRLIGVIDPAGQNVLGVQYNDLNKVVAQTDVLGRTINLTYDENNRTLTASDGATQNRFVYDDKARMVEEIDALNKFIKYTYNIWLSPETITDKRGNVTRYQYDARGNVTKTTAPDGTTVDAAYNSADLPTSITDNRYPSSRVTNLTYDAKHNPIKQDVAGIISESSYDQYGNLSQAKGPLGQTASFQYNNFGLPTVATNSLGSQMQYEYDSRGFLTKQTDPVGAITTFTHDAVGKVLTAKDDAGTTSYTYDNLDRLTKVTLPDGTNAQYTYNTANQISKVTDAKGNNTTYTYDLRGNLLSRKTAAGSEYKTEYDALSRPVKQITPLGKTYQATYDEAGNPITSTDAKNQVTAQVFDNMSRPTQSTFADQTGISRTYDTRGNVLTATDPSGQVSFSYDQFDRLTQNKDPFGNTVNYTYDASGRRTSLTYPSGQKVNYVYNANNQLTSVTDWNNQATQLAYYANGLLKEKKLANGITEKYDYDSANRLSRLTYINSTNQVLGQTDIERSPVGNITRLNETGSFFTDPLGGPTPTPQPSASPTPTPPPAPQQSFIQGRWRFEEDSGTRNDSSGKNNQLTDRNGVLASTDHKEGTKSADLERDGSQYLSISDASQQGLDVTGEMTIGFWVKPESLGDVPIVDKFKDTDHQRSYHVDLTSAGGILFQVSSNGTNAGAPIMHEAGSAAIITPGNWYHVTVIFAPSSKMEVYVNGALSGSTTSNVPAGIFNSNASFNVAFTDHTGGTTFDGFVDDLYVYNKALTGSEVVQLMQSAAGGGVSSPPPSSTGPVTIFTYDALGQLTKAAYPDSQTFDYAYDAIGNRLGNTYDADAKLLQAGSTTFTYDENGAVKTKQSGSSTKSFTVNPRQELTQVGDSAAAPETWEFSYTKQTDSAWNIDIGSYSAPAIVDLDSDSKLDLLIGESGGTLKHYENNGSTTSPNFQLQNSKFANIDIGSYSTPDLVDIDGDDDIDLFIGKSDGTVTHYKNSGSKTNPVFALVATKLSNIDIGSDSTPRFADIDADSDFDLFIGKSNGEIAYYKNTGTKTAPVFTLQAAKYNNWDVGSDSAPVFAKLDSDDDLDLLIGKSDGTLVHYNNVGSKTQPNFQLQNSKFQNIDIGSANLPFLQDLTGDGLIDLLTGESGGKLRLYNANKKVTTPPDPSPTFTYDALGSRIKKTANSVETRYVNDITEGLPYVLAELNSSNQLQSLNLYAGGVTSMGPAATASRIYPLTDPLGNVRFLTNSTGTLVTRYSYDPYGNIRKKEGTVNSTFTFSGEQFDPETSLTFLRARYYDSSTGTFLSRDPVLGSLDTPIEHGEYLYARNNPVNLSDPSGEETYRQNRLINSSRLASNFNPATHTFIFTTRADGTLEHTYSWTNPDGWIGWWEMDLTNDKTAANVALKKDKGLNQVGPDELDPYIYSTYQDWNDNSWHVHRHGGPVFNCKQEADLLLIEAKRRMREDSDMMMSHYR